MFAQNQHEDETDDEQPIELYVTNSAPFWTDTGHIAVRFYGWNSEGEQDSVEVTGLKPEFYIPRDQYEQEQQALNTHSKVTDIDHGHDGLFGEDLTRLQFRSVGPRRDLADRFDQTYEADVWYTEFARIQLGLYTGLRAPSRRCEYTEVEAIDLAGEDDPRVVTFDIENDDRQGFPIDDGKLVHADSEILSIAAHDSYTDETVLFLYTGGRSFETMFGIEDPEGIEDLHEAGLSEDIDSVKARPDERQMLVEFACWIQDIDPDLMTGWNFEGYDAPYLVARMEEVGVNADRMARDEGSVKLDGNGYAEIKEWGGRTVYDLLKAYEDTKFSELESYRLDDVANEELDDAKIPHPDMGYHELWREDPVRFCNYNAKDTLLTVRINEEAGVLDFKNALREEVGVDFEQTRENNDYIEMFTRRKLHEKGVHGPTAEYRGKEDFGGGHVFDPAEGVFENVTGIDVKSLYPMTMRMFNLSPEKKLTDKPPAGFPANEAPLNLDDPSEPDTIWFDRREDGIFKELVDDAIDLKETYRDKANAARERGDREMVEVWDERYGVAKTITNSIFGVLGWEQFFLYDKQTAAAITSLGQKCIQRSAKHVRSDTPGEVIYGDTDSNYIKWPDGWAMKQCLDAAKQVCETLNEEVYPKYANECFGVPVEDCEWLIEPENYLRRFFQSGKKKRYAYLMWWDEGDDIRDDPEVKISGYGSKRSDFSELTQEVQKGVIKDILHGKDDTEIAERVREAADEIHPGLDYEDWGRIGIPGGLGKRISRENADSDECYNWSSKGDHPQDAHPRAAWNANHLLGTNIGQGSKPKRVYIRTHYAEQMDRDIDVIGFEKAEALNNYEEDLHVDAERMTECCVIRPLNQVLGAVGIDVHAAIKGQMQQGLGAFM